MSLRIKNKYIIGLASWLNSLSLMGAESRERTRFVKDLTNRIREFQEFYNELIAKYCPKDKDGKFKMKEENGIEVFDVPREKVEEFKKEYEDLMEEDFIIDITDVNKKQIETIKSLVLDTDYKFGPQDDDDEQEKKAKIRQAQDYDEWCEIFESLDI